MCTVTSWRVCVQQTVSTRICISFAFVFLGPSAAVAAARWQWGTSPQHPDTKKGHTNTRNFVVNSFIVHDFILNVFKMFL